MINLIFRRWFNLKEEKEIMTPTRWNPVVSVMQNAVKPGCKHAKANPVINISLVLEYSYHNSYNIIYSFKVKIFYNKELKDYMRVVLALGTVFCIIYLRNVIVISQVWHFVLFGSCKFILCQKLFCRNSSTFTIGSWSFYLRMVWTHKFRA